MNSLDLNETRQKCTLINSHNFMAASETCKSTIVHSKIVQ